MTEAKAPGRVESAREGRVREEQRARVDHGDEVFYNHPSRGLTSGRIVAVGRDGLQIEGEDGEVTPVLHDAVVGHKARARRRLRLIETGEDGSIAEDEFGRRTFVAGRLDAEGLEPGEVEQLKKALASGVLDPAAELVSSVAEPSSAMVDIELMRAGFVPSVEYIRKSYGEHWGLPDRAGEVDDLRAQVLEVARSVAEVAQGLQQFLAKQ